MGNNITWKKREKRSNIILPSILSLLGRISSGKERKARGTENLREENQDSLLYLYSLPTPYIKKNIVSMMFEDSNFLGRGREPAEEDGER